MLGADIAFGAIIYRSKVKKPETPKLPVDRDSAERACTTGTTGLASTVGGGQAPSARRSSVPCAVEHGVSSGPNPGPLGNMSPACMTRTRYPPQSSHPSATDAARHERSVDTPWLALRDSIMCAVLDSNQRLRRDRRKTTRLRRRHVAHNESDFARYICMYDSSLPGDTGLMHV